MSAARTAATLAALAEADDDMLPHLLIGESLNALRDGDATLWRNLLLDASADSCQPPVRRAIRYALDTSASAA